MDAQGGGGHGVGGVQVGSEGADAGGHWLVVAELIARQIVGVHRVEEDPVGWLYRAEADFWRQRCGKQSLAKGNKFWKDVWGKYCRR